MPLDAANRILNRRWVMNVLAELDKQPLRFNELRKRLPQVSTKSLGRVLASLEQEGIVKRTVRHIRPLAVTYSLASHDKLLHQIIHLMEKWGAQRLKLTPPVPDPSALPESAYNTKQRRKVRPPEMSPKAGSSRPKRKP